MPSHALDYDECNNLANLVRPLPLHGSTCGKQGRKPVPESCFAEPKMGISAILCSLLFGSNSQSCSRYLPFGQVYDIRWSPSLGRRSAPQSAVRELSRTRIRFRERIRV
eukprot:4561298-Pyramimonas_sp.AAC.1